MKPLRMLALALLIAVLPAPAARAQDTTLPPVVGRNLKHTVKPGEDLYTLGLRYRLAIDHFMWANGVSSLEVPAGRKLVVPTMHVLPGQLEEGLIINLPERGVYLFKNHEMVAFYPCAIGSPGRFATPTGQAKIVNKQMYPTWYPPEWAGIKDPVPYSGPDHPLGDRWIGLSIDGVGLHGTNQPMSIGQSASHGCMRMYPEVVRVLFDQVKVGMPAHVVYEPVKVGISPEDKKIYVQIYQDVYGRIPDMKALLKEKLEKAGVADLIDDRQIAALLANKTTLPQAVLGDDIVIKVNGKRVPTSLAPFMRDGIVWASSEVIKAIGAQLAYDKDQKSLIVTRDRQEVVFQVGEPPARTDSVPDFTPRMWNGKSVLPLKPILTSLNLEFKWVPRHKTLLIYCNDLNARL